MRRPASSRDARRLLTHAFWVILLISNAIFLGRLTLSPSASSDHESKAKRTLPRAPPESPALQEDDYDPRDILVDDVTRLEHGWLDRVETAMIAPQHLIRSVSWLRPGVLIRSTQGPAASVLAEGSVVLVARLGEETYRGYVVNRPLPKAESDTARSKLRLVLPSDAGGPQAEFGLKEVRLGNGGPVKVVGEGGGAEDFWTPIHSRVEARDAIVLSPQLAVGGDVRDVLFSLKGDQKKEMLLVYGCASWLPGQLEQEILNGKWTLLGEARDMTQLFGISR